MALLYQNSVYRVNHHPQLNESVRLFLDQIQWGSRGTRYRRPVTPAAAQRLYRPWAFSIETSETILGSVVANQYTFSDETDGYYFRYFASHPSIRGQMLLGLNARRVLTWIEGHQRPSDFSYAFLEKKNEASLKMVQHLGFKPYHTSLTLGFSRFSPRLDPRVRAVTLPTEQAQITELLRKYYQGHSFVHPHGWHYQGHYYILEEKGEVRAGVQVIPAQWEIRQMEGVLGKYLVRFGQYLPWVNRIFNPAHFKFLGLEGLYVQPGYEADLIVLMEHVLALFKTNAALFWQDPSSPYYLGNRRDLGVLHTFVNGTGSWLMAKNLPHAMQQQPAYISCFDFV